MSHMRVRQSSPAPHAIQVHQQGARACVRAAMSNTAIDLLPSECNNMVGANNEPARSIYMHA